MRRFIYLTLAAALGAGSYLGYHHLAGSRRGGSSGVAASGSTEVAQAEASTGSPRQITAPGPILSADVESAPAGAEEERAAAKAPAPEPPGAVPGTPVPGTVTPGTVTPGTVAPGGALPGGSSPREGQEPGGGGDPAGAPLAGGHDERAAPPRAEAARPAAESAREGVRPPAGEPADLEGMASLARAAFEAGDKVRGVKLLREVFRAGKDRHDVDLVSVARRLVEIEERGATERPLLQPSPPGSEPRDLYRYLVEKDSDPAWRYRSCLGLGTIQAQEVTPELVRSAWEHLTLAYLAAASQPQRRQVITILEPFLKKHIFSKRYSPLMATHTVKSGDSLHRIAKSHGTTEEAMQRLNQISGNVIHPGQRLIVLEGKPRIFVKKSEFRLWMMMGDRLLLEAPVGLGRDSSTPAAVFQVAVRQKDPIWYRRGEPPIPAGDPRNILGTRWLGFKDTEELSGFGIHGTTDPTSIGKEESSGCIRMYSRDLEILWDFVPLGSEVEILE